MKLTKSDIDLLANSLKEHNLSGIEYSDSEFSLKLTDNGVNNTAPFFLNSNKFDNQTNGNVNNPTEESNEIKEVETKKGTAIKSPIVGNYYNTKKPGEPPFIKVGDVIKAGDVVAIIEAMKVMNEVKAPISGTVVDLPITNGEFVDTMTEIIIIEGE